MSDAERLAVATSAAMPIEPCPGIRQDCIKLIQAVCGHDGLVAFLRAEQPDVGCTGGEWLNADPESLHAALRAKLNAIENNELLEQP